ncbi:hypothetical protein Q361_10727 [Flavobacterium croceum DSM 17960]|uniref:Lipoprotein n=1 Tax=Flavobacterium croceum DSM 17960 TaxID=1121886 RepID=A0A2S4N812_9FLAO|nr:hypothetical protein Q361_10727 [Flavobacterium croceum DSM 17960]
MCKKYFVFLILLIACSCNNQNKENKPLINSGTKNKKLKVSFKSIESNSTCDFVFDDNKVTIIQGSKETEGTFFNGVISTELCSDCYRIGHGDDGEGWALEVFNSNGDFENVYHFDEEKSTVTFDELTIFMENGNFEKQPIASSNTKSFHEIQMELIDGSLKKAKVYLGEPDVFEPHMGHITKGFVVYYDKVQNNANTPKHLILFLRWQDGNNNPEIEEIYSVSDNEKACFGIHCLEIRNHEIYTNTLDLIQDEGYSPM